MHVYTHEQNMCYVLLSREGPRADDDRSAGLEMSQPKREEPSCIARDEDNTNDIIICTLCIPCSRSQASYHRLPAALVQGLELHGLPNAQAA